MRCENLYCMYWSCDRCTLDKISLNVVGSCEECIYVSIPEEVLQRERERALLRYAVMELEDGDRSRT